MATAPVFKVLCYHIKRRYALESQGKRLRRFAASVSYARMVSVYPIGFWVNPLRNHLSSMCIDLRAANHEDVLILWNLGDVCTMSGISGEGS